MDGAATAFLATMIAEGMTRRTDVSYCVNMARHLNSHKRHFSWPSPPEPRPMLRSSVRFGSVRFAMVMNGAGVVARREDPP